jgi:hypothetical protein
MVPKREFNQGTLTMKVFKKTALIWGLPAVRVVEYRASLKAHPNPPAFNMTDFRRWKSVTI